MAYSITLENPVVSHSLTKIHRGIQMTMASISESLQFLQIIWQKVDSTGGEELIAIGSRVDPKLGAFHDYRVLFADATTSVLFIPRTTHYHAGYYKCSLSDGGFLHQMMHVNVTNPYMVMRHPLENTHYLAPGSPVRLACDVRFTYPPPLIYWTFGRARMHKAVRPVAWVSLLLINVHFVV